mmetsp:Transcript_30128/g.71683  ORF Transcript_30128/g.71683 Transcript_30128/m.71683 type:complete len:215 (+) Transcript_30128:1256-1900(+)
MRNHFDLPRGVVKREHGSCKPSRLKQDDNNRTRTDLGPAAKKQFSYQRGPPIRVIPEVIHWQQHRRDLQASPSATDGVTARIFNYMLIAIERANEGRCTPEPLDRLLLRRATRIRSPPPAPLVFVAGRVFFVLARSFRIVHFAVAVDVVVRVVRVACTTEFASNSAPAERSAGAAMVVGLDLRGISQQLFDPCRIERQDTISRHCRHAGRKPDL